MRRAYPLVCVYDNKSRRCDIKPLESIGNYRAELVEIENNAGELANAAFREIGKALESKTRTKIFVRGEEDLITLAAIAESEDGWLVLYGQPNEGLVVVEVDNKIKSKVKKILGEMR